MNREAERLNALTEQIIGAAIDVHKKLGPGLLESAYEACLCFELQARGLVVDRGMRVGLMLNFNVKNLSLHGIVRKVHGFPD